MNIEQDIFQKSNVDYKKLIEYGFKMQNNNYYYSKKFHNNRFRADIIITNNGNIEGKVFDVETNEEYTNIRTTMEGTFVSSIRQEYINILYDIKDKCFNETYFIMKQSNRIVNKIFEKYKIKPEFLWKKFPNYGVFRNESGKWFGIIMDIDMFKLTQKEHNKVEIINVKLNEEMVRDLLEKEGYYKAYHINSKTWITINLDDKISDEVILELIDISYQNTK